MPLLVSGDVRSIAGTGWAAYTDTQYTSGSPFSVSANTDTLLPNNAGAIVQSQKPADIPAFYAGGKITGRNGDGLGITLELTLTPTTATATTLDIWIDIGGSIGQLYRRTSGFPKGQNVAQSINASFFAYTLDTWTANGGAVYVRTNAAATLYGVRYVLTRTHKANASAIGGALDKIEPAVAGAWTLASTGMTIGRSYRLFNVSSQSMAVTERSSTPTSAASYLQVPPQGHVDMTYDGTNIYARISDANAAIHRIPIL